jgi:hypothetical protein
MLGRAGARRVRRRYGWDRIARSTLEVYGGLAAGAARPAGKPAATQQLTWGGRG